MIKNAHILEQLDAQYDREHPLTLEQKYAILDALYLLVKAAGHFDPNDTTIDEQDIELARVLNADLSGTAGKNC